MILFTFALAFVLVYLTAPQTSPVDVKVSSQTSSILQVSSMIETSSNILLNNSSSVISSNQVSDVGPKEKITMEFTAEEIRKIEELIRIAQNSQLPFGESNDTSSQDNVAVPSNVSIYFEDIEGGYIYTNNDEYKYFIASLIKSPYCMYLYTLAEQGKCDLEEMYTIEFKDIQEGTGKIKDKKEEEFPLEKSVRELMSYAIRYSDNTAVEALRKHYNHTGYLNYAKSLGINYPKDVSYIVNGKICAKDAGVYIKAIYNYIENGKYGDELKKDMSHTSNPMIRSKYPVVRKYGWAELSFHDMAIVYAPQPYLLTILSDKGLGKKEDYKLFSDVSTLIETFQSKRYQ